MGNLKFIHPISVLTQFNRICHVIRLTLIIQSAVGGSLYTVNTECVTEADLPTKYSSIN